MLDLNRRKKRIKNLPVGDGKKKYSETPHPLLKLSRLALPDGTNPQIIENAAHYFSTSVTIDTQSGYATATRHYLAAEEALGKKFSLPPSEAEMIFLTTYLLNQNLTVPTVRSYLAGIKFYLLSLGIANPPKLPPLAEQLLMGKNNQLHNTATEALKKTKRAITLDLLKLLGHAISRSSKWSDFEKSLRWTVFLSAWWGSFRIGELLSKRKHNFDPSSTLLASGL